MLNILYNFFFINILLFIFSKNLSSKFFKLKKNKFLILFIYHLFFTTSYIYFFQDKPADYQKYIALKYTKVKDFSFSDSFTGTELVYTIIKFFKNILFFDELNIIFIFSIISFFGIIIFIENLIKIGVDKKIAYLLFFIPSIHFWTSSPGKDSLILFFLSCFFKFYIDRKLMISMFLLFFVLLIRPQIGTIFFISIAITEFIIVSSWIKKAFIIFFISLFFYSVLNLDFSSGYITNTSIFSDNIFYQMLSQINSITYKFIDTSTSYHPSHFTINIFNYMFFPIEFIFSNNSFIVNASILIEIFAIFLLLIVLKKHKNNFKLDKKMLYFLIICTLLYLMILPQTFFNYGLNARQKWMIIPFIIYLSFFLKNLIVKLKKK